MYVGIINCRVEEVIKEYNSLIHRTTQFPPCWLMYGEIPSQFVFKPENWTTPEEDVKVAYENIVKRGNDLRVEVTSDMFDVGQICFVQLNSRARDAAPREWHSVGRIKALDVDEKHRARVVFLNTNVGRPKGSEDDIELKHLFPVKDQIDYKHSLQEGDIVLSSINNFTGYDCVLYLEEMYLQRKITTADVTNGTFYLCRYSGEGYKQATWVLSTTIKDNQLSHVEKLVSISK
jgi:hypothetical protein